MKRTNFREMNKKLNELNRKEREASFAYLISESGTLKYEEAIVLMNTARNELDQFRNTKISEGI